jgi:hypothetical protein
MHPTESREEDHVLNLRLFHFGLFGGATLGVLAVLLLTSHPAIAKVAADRVTITSPGLTDVVEVTDSATLSALGRIMDVSHPIEPASEMTGAHLPYSRPHIPDSVALQHEQITEPLDAGPSYTLIQYYRDGMGQISAVRLHYHPHRSGDQGYAYFVGFDLGDGFVESAGKWFVVTPASERTLQDILTSHGVRLTATPSPSSAWVACSTILILLMGRWLIRRGRRQPAMA